MIFPWPEYFSAIAVGLILIPLADQILKLVLRRALGPSSISLGPLGSVRMVTARIWWARFARGPSLAMTWAIWFFAAGSLVFLSRAVPSSAWWVGLILGGSFSHLLETSFQKCVIDYVCLRFWPAFNLADVAISLGAIGLAVLMITR